MYPAPPVTKTLEAKAIALPSIDERHAAAVAVSTHNGCFVMVCDSGVLFGGRLSCSLLAVGHADL